MDSLIRTANLRGLPELMRELGGDAHALLTRFHIPPALLDNPDTYVPHRNQIRVLEMAAIECQCPDFGLRISQWQGLDMLGPVAVIARNTENVLNAFQGIARYLYVHGPALKLGMFGRNARGDYCFDFRIEMPSSQRLEQSYELSLANGARILQLLSAGQARPARVYFTHRQLSPDSVYRKAFGCPVQFEHSHCGFDIRESDALRPLQAADRQTLRLMGDFLESRHPPGIRLSDRVSELIHRLLPTGYCRIDTVAEQLALHPRSLQRRLRDEGLRYEDLLESIRQDKAREYLSVTALSLGQIAGLLGYTEQSAFNRACRRWFDCTPRQWRKKHAT